ncbi:MAG TPA: winged helix-turn-helix domain-containing protein [Candidatus Aquicultor sp.]|jgi:DNA-binding transcriptional ArsR family regulator
MLELLFRSRVTAKLVTYFVSQPSVEVYLREVSRAIDEPASAVQRELGRLEAFGLIRSRRHGNHKYFTLEQQFPILPELRRLYTKTDGAAEFLRERLEALDGVQLAFIYGEFAGPEHDRAESIDTVIIGTVARHEIDMIVPDVETTLGRKLQYIQYSPEEFRHLIEENDASLAAALNGEKIVLIANLAEKR